MNTDSKKFESDAENMRNKKKFLMLTLAIAISDGIVLAGIYFLSDQIGAMISMLIAAVVLSGGFLS